jgi:HEAT repeat protein
LPWRGAAETWETSMAFTVAVLILALLPAALPAQEDLTPLFEQLARRDPEIRTAAAQKLIEHGPASLTAYLETIDAQAPMAFDGLLREVLPHLDPVATGQIVLRAFEQYSPAHEALVRAEREALGEGFPREWRQALLPVHEEVPSPDLMRWYAALRCIMALRCQPALDQLLTLYRSGDHRSRHFREIAVTIFLLDPDLAHTEFHLLCRKPELVNRLKGLWSCIAIQELPPEDVLQATLSDAHPALLDVAEQVLMLCGLEQLEILLAQLTSEDDRVVWVATCRVQALSGLSAPAVQEVVAGAASRGERAARWRAWWREREGRSEETLAAQALDDAIRLGTPGVDEGLLRRLDPQAGEPRALQVLQLALGHTSPRVQVLAGKRLVEFHRAGVEGAADLLIEHCTPLGPVQAYSLLPPLSDLGDDPRVVPLFLGWLRKARPERECWWSRRMLQALARCADERVIELMIELLERGLRAGAVLASVEEAETLHPRLLEKLMTTKRWEDRLPYEDAMERIGGDSLSRVVAAALPETAWGGLGGRPVRLSLFQLLQAHPTQAIRPQMLELLESSSLRDRVQAAKVLDALGDLAGVRQLIKDINHPELEPALMNPQTIGHELRYFTSPEIPKMLLEAYQAEKGQRRACLRLALEELRDPKIDEILEAE